MPADSCSKCGAYREKFKPNLIICSAIILLFACSALGKDTPLTQNDISQQKSSTNCASDAKHPDCNKSPQARLPRLEQQPPKASDTLMALINWLFGPPATDETSTQTGFSAGNSSIQTPSPKPEPKESKRNKKSIVTDIEMPVGTELPELRLQETASQLNLKEPLDHSNVKQGQRPNLKTQNNVRSERRRREPYKPVKVPYTTPKSAKLATNLFRQRQLLVNPYEQQMVALQQQQAAAVANAMLQQQQMDAILNGNRYALLDDYDNREDDEESDEDSDEFDDLTHFGAPTIEHHHMYLRNALSPPPIPVMPLKRKLGWGLRRRSVTDKKRKPVEDNGQWGRGNWRRGVNRKYKNRASLKNGQWFLDDYDLNSEFHDGPESRKHLDQPELDEEEHYYNQQVLKQRSGVDQARQDAAATTTEEPSAETDSGSSSSSSSTEASGEGSSSTAAGEGGGATNTTTTASSGNSTEASTSESSSGTDTTDSTGETDATTEPVASTEKPKPRPPYRATLNCRCGTQSVRGEGSGGDGTVVRFNVNPWLVSISRGRQHLCSGSIINDRFILTSKSCVQAIPPSTLNVTAGLTSRNATSYFVAKIIPNPEVNLALLQLKTTIKPNHVRRPVCLPIGKRYAGQYSTGTLVTFKQVPPNVQMLDTEVAILNNSSKCKGKDKAKLCAGPPGSMKCGGDTGGVLMVYRGGYSYEQIGVVAETVGCRSTSTPGVYTDVRKKTRWILNNSKLGNYCKSPEVTDEDLMSTTRFGDPNFVLSEDFEDSDEFEDFGFGNDDSRQNNDEEDLNHAAEVPELSWEEE